jgi:hypothetical protein
MSFSKRTKIITFACSLFLSVILVTIIVGAYVESRSINFGSTADPFPRKRLKQDCCRNINMEGLAELKAYGSGVIYYKDFKEYFKGKSDKVYVVNLLEDDLYYHKDLCLRWYGLGYMDKNLGEPIFAHKPFKFLYKNGIRLVFGTPPFHDKSQLQTESQILERLGARQYNLLKGITHWLGNLRFIENLIAFFESLPPDAHLYVHCAHGRGRTTTLLVLYDIFKNGKKVPLKDITNRHFCLGREDVMNTELWKTGNWTQEALDARRNLIERFYAYRVDPKGYGHQSWTQWNHAHGFNDTKVTVHRKEEPALVQ